LFYNTHAPCAVPAQVFDNMTFASFHEPTHLYFVTASVCGWKRLFVDRKYAFVVLDSLAWMQRQNRMILFAFALMPSHLHAILKPESGTIGDIVQQFGSYTAHAILEGLQSDGRNDLLDFFHQERRDKRHQHSVWQDIQAKNIYSADFLFQKIEYIHNNPVSKDWRLAVDRADYQYSSACLYDYGKSPMIEVIDVREWLQ